MSILSLSASQLRKAADLQEKITSLESELASILGGEAQSNAVVAPSAVPKKRGMSAEGKAKIAAAQKLRWAKFNAAQPKPAKKFNMSAAAKAKISAAAKARWAKIKAKK